MQSLSSIRYIFCSILLSGAAVLTAFSITATPAALASTQPTQDNSVSSDSNPSAVGTWQVSWNAENGRQRQATMQLKQDGSKLSGSLETERGSAPLKGSLNGSQINFNVKMPKREVSFSGTLKGAKMSGTTGQGAAWTATRQ